MVRYRLICIEGDVLPTQIDVDEAIECGRDPHCDVRLLGESSSRYHFQLTPEAEGLRVRDHQSRNGTWVNGQRVNEILLRPGMTLSAAEATFMLVPNDVHQRQVVGDGGLTLGEVEHREPRPWQGGDDLSELTGLHALTRRLAQCTELQQRAKLLCGLCASLFASERCSLVRGGSVLFGNCSPRLAGRLGSGSSARLLTLGKDLRGQTIAAEAVGSAACLPLATDTFLLVIRGIEQEALRQADLERLARLSAEVAPYFQSTASDPLQALVGDSSVMQQLRKRLQRLGSVDSTVLISGSSGTGKELIANCLHQISGRRDAPFIALNCAAVAPSLFEAELFGHEKGAFSGADVARPGRIRAADGGTLFLDEIGELPLELQAKLLRVLQEGEVEPVGSAQPIKVNVRIISATNRQLNELVEAGGFREDLFYRLDVLRIHSPDLTQRREDIPLLAQALLARLAEQHGRPPPLLSNEALNTLHAYPWPGNVRQLVNTLERAMVLADTVIEAEDLELLSTTHQHSKQDGSFDGERLLRLAEVEARHVAMALAHCHGNRSEAARQLGISRPTLLRKIGEYGIEG